MKVNVKSLSFNSILSFVNLFFFFVFIFTLINIETYQEIFQFESKALIILYFAQIQFFLFHEKKNNNPILLIFCFVTIFFTNSRFVTIFFESGYDYIDFRIQDMNYVIFYLFLSNIFLFLGLQLNKIHKIRYENNIRKYKVRKHIPQIMILCALFLYVIDYYNLPLLGLFFKYLSVFVFNGEALVIISFICFSFLRKELNNKQVLSFCLVVSIYAIFLTLTGRRALILNLFLYYIFSKLVFNHNFRIKIKRIFFLVLLVPFSILIFGFSTLIRYNTAQSKLSESFIPFLDIVKTTLLDFNIFDYREILFAIFRRIAYFDYTVYYIIASEKFSEVFNLFYYFQSIIDNFLSPGFNVFDSPRVSNALFLIKNGLDVNFENVREYYNSVQIGLYAELYNLVGYVPSLLFYFLLGYFFSKSYNNVRSDNFFEEFLDRSIILFVFYLILISYGFDWVLIYCFSVYVTLKVFKFLIKSTLKQIMKKSNREAFNWILKNFPFESYIPLTRMESYFEMPNTVFKYVGKSAKILDFGAGPCDKTAMLSLLGFDVTAFDDFGDDWYNKNDNKQKILNFAKKSGIDYKLADKKGNLNIECEYFDVLILNNVIEHLHNSPRDFINDLLNYLKPDGFLIVDVPNAVNLRKRIDVFFGKTNYPTFSSYYWSPNPWRGHNREYVKNDLIQLNKFLGLKLLEVSDHHYHLDRIGKITRMIFKLICKFIPGIRESWVYVGQKPIDWKPRLIPSKKELKDANKKNYFKG